MNTYKLEELLTLKYGKRQNEVECANGQYPIYGTGGIFGYAIDFLYNQPSILIGRKGTLSKPIYTEKPFWVVDTMFYSIINTEKVIPKYLYYSLSRINFDNYNEGTTIPSLRVQTLNSINISIHSLAEQLHIVDILGSIDEKIENNQDLILARKIIL